MRLLLDSQAMYWFLRGNRRLSHKARAAIENSRNTIFVSAATGYEMSFKRRLGLLDFDVEEIAAHIRQAKFAEMSISMEHTIRAGDLPTIHRDPWDRVLIAQALAEDLVVVTSDATFEPYGVKVLW
jgi:PIN domain nuclease of toxin-antitoxin system